MTYENDVDNSYVTTKRSNKDIEFYIANLNSNNEYELTLQYGFYSSTKCKENFFLDSDK